jgi:hypothetical protein
LFSLITANAQTCGTSQVTYSGYTANFLPKWNATTGCISNSTLIDNTGKIGIGLTAPASLLHAAGQICTGIPYGGLGGASAATGSLLFYNSSNTNTVNIQSGETTTSYTLTLPQEQGAASSVLTNDGSGGLSWVPEPYWTIQGNSGTTASTAPIGSNATDHWIGTKDDMDWVMATNAYERMRISNTGNVGIGTKTPATANGISVGGRIFNLINTSDRSFLNVEGTYADISLVSSSASANQKWMIIRNTGGKTSFISHDDAGASVVTALTIKHSDGYVGIGTGSPNYKLDVNGTSNFTGNMTCAANVTITGIGWITNAWTISDQMFKTNIDSLPNAITIIRQLKPKSYYFDTANFKEFNFIHEKQYGFIAQDLEQILPELVKSTTKNAELDTSGNVVYPALTYKAINYIEVIAILTKGIQEQQQKIESLQLKTLIQDSINTLLQNQLNQLQTTISNCCVINATRSMQSPATDTTQSQPEVSVVEPASKLEIDVELNDAQSIVLEQNVPNPFAEQTTINYSLPDSTVNAQMLFYNAQGKLIQSAKLVQKGNGILNVFASDLSSGIYTYVLVVDGKIIETKKMVKQ